MAKVIIFTQDGMPAKAVITGTPHDDMDNFQLLDTVNAFIAGDAVVMADSRDHEIEVVR